MGKSGGVTFCRRCGIIGSVSSFSFSFPDIYSSLPAFSKALNEGRCQDCVFRDTGKAYEMYDLGENRIYKDGD